MEVRGSVVSNINAYVKEAHPDNYEKWISSLSEKSQELMERTTSSKWYPINEGILEPTRIMCDLFYGSPKEGAWKSGRYSAEVGLTGLYKVFVVISSPSFLIKRASRVLATFYAPTEVNVVDSSDHSMLVHFTKLPTENEYLEYRIAGWMEKALELCGCKDLSVRTTRSIAKGDELFEVQISWR
ncbi:hypothetical protein [Ekhidna sp. To15]|uniref:hypothetical protein n=1 Tax=Ekhidna sp. To15 TaxID=3395267 RepID=UPI003F52534F